MKMVSWNVNGLRACVTKGFVDILISLMQIFSAYKKQNYKKDRSIYHLRDTINTGIMLRKRVTQALQFSQKRTISSY